MLKLCPFLKEQMVSGVHGYHCIWPLKIASIFYFIFKMIASVNFLSCSVTFATYCAPSNQSNSSLLSCVYRINKTTYFSFRAQLTIRFTHDEGQTTTCWCTSSIWRKTDKVCCHITQCLSHYIKGYPSLDFLANKSTFKSSETLINP